MSSRRSVMTLFSAPDEPHSHRTRIVLAEKGVEIDIINVVPGRYPEDLLDLNPYHSLPTLVDRDLVLYDSRVIIEYLDERFPHPPLMPVDPILRAQFRLALYRIERDWYGLAQQIDEDHDKKHVAHKNARCCAMRSCRAPMSSRSSHIFSATNSRWSMPASPRSCGACDATRSICRRRRRRWRKLRQCAVRASLVPQPACPRPSSR